MDDLLQEFLAETNESIELLDSELVRLEQEPDDPELLSHIFRVLHTIKGTCGFLGLPRLGAIAHAGENVLDQFRNGEIPVTPEAMTPILEALDKIRDLLVDLETSGTEPSGDDKALIEKLDNVALGQNKSVETIEEDSPTVDLFKEIGGASTIDAAVEFFLEHVTSDNTLSSLIPDVDVHQIQGALRVLLTKLADGPKEIISEDTSSTIDTLSNIKMTATERSSAMSHLKVSLQELEVSDIAISQICTRVEELTNGTNNTAEDPVRKSDTHTQAPSPQQSPDAQDKTSSSASIRVNVDVLESLMTVVSELVLTRNQLLQILREETESEFAAPLQRLNQVTSELQESVMLTRMQPIGKAWAKIPRIVRDLSQDLGKKIDLIMEGAETELDRQVLDEIKDPLTHMVRNAADHGLESTEERLAAGKSETGHVKLNARHEGGHIILEISDDGAGLDAEKIKSKAISSGLATESDFDGLSEKQIHQFIFKAGFSTAKEVTSVSGRGVGMDVVGTNIAKIGGTIELTSQKGSGTTFTIKIPLTLAIISALIVECGDEQFALPQNSVVELVRVTPKSVSQIEHLKETPVLRLRDRLLPLVHLRSLLKLGEREENGESYVIVCRVGSYHFGIVVDRVFDTEEIVVKPVSKVLRDIPVYAGNTIMGDGSVIMILDPNGIAKQSGEVDLSTDQTFDRIGNSDHQSETTSMLIFRAGTPALKAVPLGLVARIEEIDVQTVEKTGGNLSVQYRDSLMPLQFISEEQNLAEREDLPVLVFTEGDRAIGLITDEIVDIVQSHVNIELASNQAGLLGTAIIDGKATELIDAAHICEKSHGNLFDVTTESSFGEDLDGRRILLIDDSSFFRTLLTPILEAAGYHVTQACDGDEGLKLCETEQSFDIVISDLEMPHTNGFEFVTQARRLEGYEEKPIIALSSHASPLDVEHCISAGFTGHVEKLNRDRLIKKLRNAEIDVAEVA